MFIALGKDFELSFTFSIISSHWPTSTPVHSRSPNLDAAQATTQSLLEDKVGALWETIV